MVKVVHTSRVLADKPFPIVCCIHVVVQYFCNLKCIRPPQNNDYTTRQTAVTTAHVTIAIHGQSVKSVHQIIWQMMLIPMNSMSYYLPYCIPATSPLLPYYYLHTTSPLLPDYLCCQHLPATSPLPPRYLSTKSQLLPHYFPNIPPLPPNCLPVTSVLPPTGYLSTTPQPPSHYIPSTYLLP